MSETADRLTDVMKQIAADDDVLRESRERRKVVLGASATFGGVSGTYASGSVAMGVAIDPVEDADGGLILDRRSYPSLGPDGGGETPVAVVQELHGHLGPLVRQNYPKATVHDMKRGVTVYMHEPLGCGQDPYVDVVLAMQRKDAPGLWIPNLKANRWDASHPQRHVELLTVGTRSLRRTRAQTIRLAKAWNKQFSEPAFNSFNLVALAWEAILAPMSIDAALRLFFEHAAVSIAIRRTEDPAQVSGPINLEKPKQIALARLCAARDSIQRACDHDDDVNIVAAELHSLFPNYLPKPATITKLSFADMLRDGTPRVRSTGTGLAVAGAVTLNRSFGGHRD